MKLLKSLFIAACTILYIPAALAGIAGTWTTIDESGAKRAVVNLSVSGDTLSGTIAKIYPKAGDTGICSKCPGAFKDKKIQGMQFIWGLKKVSDNEWADGKILDPKTGKIYRAKMTLNGNKLEVRGYVGISMLGRSQTWVR